MNKIKVYSMPNEHGAEKIDAFEGQKADFYVEPGGNLTLVGIEKDHGVGRAVFVVGTWSCVTMYGETPHAEPLPSPDPEVIGALDPTQGVVQVLSGAQGVAQVGENEDG